MDEIRRMLAIANSFDDRPIKEWKMRVSLATAHRYAVRSQARTVQTVAVLGPGGAVEIVFATPEIRGPGSTRVPVDVDIDAYPERWAEMLDGAGHVFARAVGQ